MRIISGKFRGRKFNPPADNWPTRPTTDFAKEALFNIIENQLDISSLAVLDLFCGTGNHTFEFASRGCTNLTCVDKHPPAVAFVQKMITELQLNGVQIHLTDVMLFVKNCNKKFDYIFAGPPYPLTWIDEIPDMIFKQNMLNEAAWLVVEHNSKHNFESHPKFWQLRKYGGTHFSFFKN